MHVTLKEVALFLSQKFKQTTDLKHLADGWWSQVFSFTCEKGKMVIRISALIKDFLKDEYAFQHINSPEIRVPEIIATGRFDGQFYYCLSLLCEGTPADQLMERLDHAQQIAVARAQLEPLRYIHQLDTSQQAGWGLTNEKGTGGWASWPAFLLDIHNHKSPVTWQELHATTWLDGGLFEKLLDHMQTLVPYLPVEKQVLHGDYGFDNLLINDQHQVCAVLDWGEMMLGDGLYDLVHMNEPWVKEEISYLPLWLNQQEQAGMQLRYVEERLACYRIHYTLLHLHIHTTRGEEAEYQQIEQWAKQHLL
jgi:hygromycin-B 4-O-kinase